MPSVSSDYGWKPLYEAALFEADGNKILGRIAVARRAILDRIEFTLTNPSPSEQRAMDDALRNLRRLAQTFPANNAA